MYGGFFSKINALYLLHVSRAFIQHYFCLHMDQQINSMHQMMCVVFRGWGERVFLFNEYIYFCADNVCFQVY